MMVFGFSDALALTCWKADELQHRWGFWSHENVHQTNSRKQRKNYLLYTLCTPVSILCIVVTLWGGCNAKAATAMRVKPAIIADWMTSVRSRTCEKPCRSLTDTAIALDWISNPSSGRFNLKISLVYPGSTFLCHRNYTLRDIVNGQVHYLILDF